MSIRFITRYFRLRRLPARTRRFEILLPLNHNDGTEIEPEKLYQTAEELSERFGGITEDTVRIIGIWRYVGARYRDELLRIRIDTDDAAGTAFLRDYKEVLKERFQQIDIWITAHELEILMEGEPPWRASKSLPRRSRRSGSMIRARKPTRCSSAT